MTEETYREMPKSLRHGPHFHGALNQREKAKEIFIQSSRDGEEHVYVP